MDDQARTALMARLADAKAREAQLVIRVRAHADNLDELRKTLGNPYFYSPRPDADAESKSRYTGYTSNEPGLRLARECLELAKEMASIKGALRAAGLDGD
jgi:hypothetical protein